MRLDSWVSAAFAGLLVGGCASDADFTDEMPDDLPAGQVDTDGTSTGDGSTSEGNTSSSSSEGEASTTGAMSGCQSSEDCLGNDVCVASWDAESQTHGEPECSFTCIPSLDDARWCADAEACCDPDATCTARGYCVPPQDPGGADESSGGGSTGTGTGGAG